MKLTAMRCTNKFKHDAGSDNGKVTVHFHSADKQSMAIFVMSIVEADHFIIGKFYDFDSSPQKATHASK